MPIFLHISLLIPISYFIFFICSVKKREYLLHYSRYSVFSQLFFYICGTVKGNIVINHTKL